MELGEAPTLGEIALTDPGVGDVVVEMAAVALNPVDFSIANGTFYAGHPPVPFVPGIEGVGRIRGGSRSNALVYASGAGLGVVRNGLASARFIVPESVLIELPDAADPVLAAALGTAGLAGWLPLSWRAALQPGETVVVLGATGTAGGIAVQAARALGAGRVVAVGRHPQRLAALGTLADAVVSLAEPDFGARLAKACAPGADVIYDPLWGEPLAVALQAARPGARVVHLGTSAGPTSTLPSGAVRGKQLSILGYSNFAVPRDVLIAAYRSLVERSIRGELRMNVTTVPLERVDAAWEGLRSGDGKFVLVP
jgi:NADPH:quinone reductase-like Zn-dependent oxidoreductase